MIDHAESPRISSWYSLTGPAREVVLASQVSLNRNLQGFPFQHRLNADGILALRRTIDTALYALDDEFVLIDGANMSAPLRAFYEDRGILAVGDTPGVSIISREHDLLIRLGTADHLRISGFAGGLDLAEARRKAAVLDQRLEEHLEYAVSLKLGYLSPEIDRVGTGLAAMTVAHLPGIEHSEGLKLPGGEELERVIMNRYGRSDEPHGSLYSAVVIASFGESEDEPIAALADYTERLLHYELEARRELDRRLGGELADTAGRALGTLRHARRLAVEETMDLLSLVRLGVALGYIDEVGLPEVTDALFVCRDSQVGILQSEDTTVPIDVLRADLMRRLLGRTTHV